MLTVLSVVVAALFGLLVGAGARLWLSRLRRGVVIRPGWVELASAVISALGVYLARDGPWLLVGWIGLLGVALTAVDLKHHRLPDAVTLPAIAATLAVVAVSPLVTSAEGNLLRAALGGLVTGSAFSALAFAAPKAMGRGDAKLAFSLGTALGFVSWQAVFLGVLLAFVIGSVVGLVGILVGRLTLKSATPFGPSMLLGCWLVLAVPGILAGVGRLAGR